MKYMLWFAWMESRSYNFTMWELLTHRECEEWLWKQSQTWGLIWLLSCSPVLSGIEFEWLFNNLAGVSASSNPNTHNFCTVLGFSEFFQSLVIQKRKKERKKFMCTGRGVREVAKAWLINPRAHSEHLQLEGSEALTVCLCRQLPKLQQ